MTETEELKLPMMEPPDAEILKVMAIYQPILAMTIEELSKRGYEGWTAFFMLHYALLDDIFTAPAGN